MPVEIAPDDYRALVDEIAGRIAALAPATPSPVFSPTSFPALRRAAVAARIEHTLLAADATPARIEQLCAEAERHGFAAVCVNPAWVAAAAARLRATPVAVVAVIGFPLGAGLGTVKRYEAAECLKLGADGLDMVMNLGALKAGMDELAREDLRGVVEIAHAAGAHVKAILETGLLSEAEKIHACELAVAAGADFVKTSTGFGAAGATAADVALLRARVGDRVGVKAAGGIRTLAELAAMVQVGADRIGTSAGVAILGELEAREKAQA